MRNLLAQGQDREVLYAELEQFRQFLREADREAEEELVMDVMDFFVGWCASDMRL